MHLATLIPDWNSLDSVRRAHSDLEGAALVFFALLVLFDILAHLSTDNEKKTLLEKIGLCCFAIAVLAEVVAYPYGQRNDTLSANAIGSLDAEAREAGSNASAALIKSVTALAQSKEAETRSGDAKDKAGKAQESLGNAESEANRAQAASSNALSIANDAKQVSREAREEADSFEKDIGSAKEQAANAESHLAEALKEAANAQAELARLKARRLLIRDSELVSALARYKGTEYMFLSVFGDDESITLLKQIDDILQRAGWDRGPLKGRPFPPAINVSSDHGSFSVSLGFAEGVHISFESTESPAYFNSLPTEKAPPYVLAASALNTNLSSSLFPSQAGLGKELSLLSGTETRVLITVGKKP